ncbi:MAG: hypothetical protein GX895_04725 [Clostridiales bacterium]|nr:hypothetical protein [Clostridiales bacterium]
MSIKFIVNSKIEVLEDSEVYKSTIQNESDDTIAISLPVKDGLYITPQIGETLQLLYYSDTHVYKLDAVVIERIVDNTVSLIVLGEFKNIMRVQRRQFVRVSAALNMKFAKVSDKEIVDEKDIIQQTMHKGILLDISGGGFRLGTSEKLNLKERIEADLPLENDRVKVLGEVVRVEMQQDNIDYYGIRFVDIDERTRDKIIQFIFTIMRKQLRNL